MCQNSSICSHITIIVTLLTCWVEYNRTVFEGKRLYPGAILWNNYGVLRVYDRFAGKADFNFSYAKTIAIRFPNN